ncbi:hypothetical protein TEK04_19955 [Klenkia sp. LSe6-5]|uniref:CsbD family protein n=1 Tax=Klenkia sesuvii TaxID=3103137 RepID=A0ABU8DZB9_9ACTN
MSAFDKAVQKGKAKAEELLGRATEVYGESHGDPAAEAAGEARRLEAEAEEQALEGGADRADEDDDGRAGAR